MLSLARRVQRRLGGLYNAGILEENSGGHEHLTLFTEKVGAFISSVLILKPETSNLTHGK